MAKAFKCDRCGKMYEYDKVPEICMTVYRNNYADRYLDFCEDCQKQLERWLRKETE